VTQAPDPKKSPGWFDEFAQKSAGLPDPQVRKSEEKPEPVDTNYNPWRIAGLGLQTAGTAVLMWWLGHNLDLYLGWGSKAAITMTVLGIVGSLYLLIKEALRYNK
jgi:hypothetical protein